jgi:NADPH2:quinone reductase
MIKKRYGNEQHTKGAVMKHVMQKTMKAVALDKFGGIEAMQVRTVDVPEIGPDEILIHVGCAGIGVWDPFEIEGGFAQLFGIVPSFPYVPGSDGAGIVEATGSEVDRFKEGDRVYGVSLANPKGGFYAEYAAIKAENASPIPENLSTEQAGVMPVDAVTAFQGLDDTLHLKKGESLLIFGASGGIGHLALQFARRMGARVFAVASGQDGLELAKSLGADKAVDGHRDDIVEAALDFAPDGFDAALFAAGGDASEKAMACVRYGGRAAYPNGVEPEPQARAGVSVNSYDGIPNPLAFEKINDLIESGPFEVHISKIFTLEQIIEAHCALQSHFLGKIGIRPI